MKLDVGIAQLQRFSDFVAHQVTGTDRHGRFVDNDFGCVHALADGFGHLKYILQICGAVLIRRRAHCDKYDLSMVNGGFSIGGKLQTLRFQILHHNLFKAWFKDRQLTLA